jgi:hypothetical protein
VTGAAAFVPGDDDSRAIFVAFVSGLACADRSAAGKANERREEGPDEVSGPAEYPVGAAVARPFFADV